MPGPEATEDSSSRERARRNWRESLGNGRFLPLGITAAAFAAAIIFLLSNPEHADLADLGSLLEGESLGIEGTIHLGLRLGALLTSVILGCWLVAAPWWARRPPVSDSSLPPEPAASKADGALMPARWFWIAVVLAVALGAALRAPRLHHGLWNDEEVAYRKFIHGGHRVDDDGELDFRPASWQRTWFYNVTGNNHVLQSVTSRVSLEFAGVEPGEVREAPPRIPPLVAGLLSIVALALLMRNTGASLAGVVGAWILALHPWHLRYSVEARGYSGMLLACLLMLLAARLARERGTWLAWGGYGTAQVGCLLCFPAAIYVVAAINIGLLIILLRRREMESLKRWSTVSVLGAAVFVQIFTPSFLRMIEWLGSPYETPRPLDRDFFLDLWTHLGAGIPLADGHLVQAFRLDLLSWQGNSPLRFWALVACLPLAVLSGAAWTLWRIPRLRLAIIAPVAALALAVLHLALKPMVFHVWYLLFLLVPFCIALGGLGQAAWRRRPALGVATAVVLVCAFGGLSMAAIKRQRDYERHPMRAAVELLRGEAPALDPRHGEVLALAIGPGSGQLISYDPRAIAVKSEEAFFEAVDRAEKGRRPVVVYLTYATMLQASLPRVDQALGDTRQFEEIGYLRGVEAFWSIRLFRKVTVDPEAETALP